MENKLKFVREVSQDALITEKADIFLNGLLGVYDNNGNYFISPKIVEELISFEKAKKYVFDNSIFCESVVPGIGEIMFQIEYIKINDEKTCARLYLLENVYKINGYLQNTIKTFLSEYVDSFENFIQKSYEHFNVVVDYDDAGRTKKYNRDAMLSTYLLAKKQYLISIESDVSDKLDDLYNRYFTKRIKILTSSKDPFSKDVLKQFNDQYKLIENKFLKNENFKDVNELLDKCVEDVSDTKEIYKNYQIEFDNKCRPALKEFYDDSNELLSKAQEKSTVNLGKQDKRKVQEILDDEHQFVSTAVNDSKLSGIIEALSVDKPTAKREMGADETLDQSQTMSEIIDKVKSTQERNKRTGYVNPEFIKAQKDLDQRRRTASHDNSVDAGIANQSDLIGATESADQSESSEQRDLDEKSHLPVGSEDDERVEDDVKKSNIDKINSFIKRSNEKRSSYKKSDIGSMHDTDQLVDASNSEEYDNSSSVYDNKYKQSDVSDGIDHFDTSTMQSSSPRIVTNSARNSSNSDVMPSIKRSTVRTGDTSSYAQDSYRDSTREMPNEIKTPVATPIIKNKAPVSEVYIPSTGDHIVGREMSELGYSSDKSSSASSTLLSSVHDFVPTDSNDESLSIDSLVGDYISDIHKTSVPDSSPLAAETPTHKEKDSDIIEQFSPQTSLEENLSVKSASNDFQAIGNVGNSGNSQSDYFKLSDIAVSPSVSEKNDAILSERVQVDSVGLNGVSEAPTAEDAKINSVMNLISETDSLIDLDMSADMSGDMGPSK